MTIESTRTNRDHLAEIVIQRMDISEMEQIIYEQVLEGYEKHDEYFEDDWERFISSDKEEIDKERGGVVVPTT